MKIHRLIAMVTVLLQTERISATELAEKFEVSVRTIYRDIEALEQAGIPIVTHTGINGGISIIDSYKIDQKLFTNQDITTLLMSIYSLSSSVEDRQLSYTLEKIKALIPKTERSAVELISKQLYIDMTPWANNPYVARSMEVIRIGLEESRLLQFTYGNRENIQSERVVEPHQLVLKENHWYLKAYCTSREDFRTFKLSRIRNPHLLEIPFIPRSFDNGMDDFKQWQHEKMIMIKLIANEKIRERVLEYCPEENIVDLENGQMEVNLPFVESDRGYGVLMSMGTGAKVLEPLHVREELIRRMKCTLESYREM